MRQELLDPLGQIALDALNTPHRAGLEVLMLDFHGRASHLAPIDGTGDDSPRANPRLVVVGLRKRATECAAVLAAKDMHFER